MYCIVFTYSNVYYICYIILLLLHFLSCTNTYIIHIDMYYIIDKEVIIYDINNKMYTL